MYAKQKLLPTMPNIQFNIDLVWPLQYELAGAHVRYPQIVCWYSPINFKPNVLFFYMYYIYLFPFLSCHWLISHFCQKDHSLYLCEYDDQYGKYKQQSWMWHVRDQLHQEYCFTSWRLIGTINNMIYFHLVYMWISSSFRYDDMYPVRYLVSGFE